MNEDFDIKPVSNDLEPFVRLYKSGEFLRSYQIKAGNTVIGRDPANVIAINDRFVSRHHFVIEYRQGQELFIQDLQSRNGTFVNGEKVKRQRLLHGDRIVFGVYEFVISYHGQPKEILEPIKQDQTIVLEKQSSKPIVEPFTDTEIRSTEPPKIEDVFNEPKVVVQKVKEEMDPKLFEKTNIREKKSTDYDI